jgi:hypothetical protein
MADESVTHTHELITLITGANRGIGFWRRLPTSI